MPFEKMNHLRQEMDRFFNYPLYQEYSGPRVDIYETGNEVVASCEIPGLESKDDLNISIYENILEIKGAVRHSREYDDEHTFRRERFSGSFRRSIALPAPVVADNSRAVYKNGILEITMPKAAPGKKGSNIDIDFH